MLLIKGVGRLESSPSGRHTWQGLGVLVGALTMAAPAVALASPAPALASPAPALASPAPALHWPGASVESGAGAGCQVVHIGPYVPPGAGASSYFRLSLARGTRVVEKMVIANPNPYRCGVTLRPAFGTTAVNGGDSYAMVGPGQRCVGPSCWLAGLPRTVTVPANSRVLAPFSINLPPKVAPGQYLAGVVGQPASPPPTPHFRRTGGGIGSVGASVVARVAIGVAITVPGTLMPRLVISSVVVAPAGLTTNDIGITMHNSGNTWVHPRGTLTVVARRSDRSAAIASATVLPGDNATLWVAEQALTGGAHQVNITLNYANGVPPAKWHGTLRFPQPPVTHVKGSTITVVAPSGLPTWATMLLLGLAAVVLVFGLLLFLFWRRERRLRQADQLHEHQQSDQPQRSERAEPQHLDQGERGDQGQRRLGATASIPSPRLPGSPMPPSPPKRAPLLSTPGPKAEDLGSPVPGSVASVSTPFVGGTAAGEDGSSGPAGGR